MLKYVYQLENKTKRNVIIRDIKPSVTEQEVFALGNKLIEKAWLYNGSKFESLERVSKIVTTEEFY